MQKTVALILPILIPSWRFFKSIEPSPRVQWTLLPDQDAPAQGWYEFRPRPQIVPPLQMLCRLVWNPAWNEALFLVSCAERIAEQPSDHSIAEIRRRIRAELARASVSQAGKWLQFRLVFVHRSEAGPSQDVVFTSQRFAPIEGPAQ